MKIFTRILLAVLVAAACPVYGQSVFLKYGPVAGIQKSTGATYVNTAAASADVVSLWSGTCNVSSFLRGDGTCATPAGTGVTSVGASFAGSWYTVTGSPVTTTGTLAFGLTTGLTANSFLATPNGSTGTLSLRTIASGDLPTINLGSTAAGGVLSTSILLGTNGGTSNGFFSVTGPTTSLKTFTFPNASATVLTSNAAVTVAQGGTGLATLPVHGVLLGEAAANIGNVAAMAADTLLQGQGASADPAAVSVNNCGSSTTALSYSTSTHTFGCQTISAGGTGTVTNVATGTGLSGGPITTTGTLTVDQSFSPTWTGVHTFTPSGTSTPLTINHNSGASRDMLITGTSGQLEFDRTQTNTNSDIQEIWSPGAGGGQSAIIVCGATGCGSAPWTGGPTGIQLAFGTTSAASTPISLATAGVERIRLSGSTGRVTVNAASSDTSLVVNAVASNVGAAFVAPNSAGVSLGVSITAGTNNTDYGLRIQQANGSATDLFKVSGSGILTAPTNYSSAGAVSTTAAGVFTTASDLRLKDVVGPATAGLDEVMKLKPIRYRWTQASGLDDPNHTVYSGFGAQDVLPVIPDAVGKNRDGYYSLTDRPITAALVNAVKEQQREIDTLRALMAALGLGFVSLIFWKRRHA